MINPTPEQLYLAARRERQLKEAGIPFCECGAKVFKGSTICRRCQQEIDDREVKKEFDEAFYMATMRMTVEERLDRLEEEVFSLREGY